jgi:hypothetical protein
MKAFDIICDFDMSDNDQTQTKILSLNLDIIFFKVMLSLTDPKSLSQTHVHHCNFLNRPRRLKTVLVGLSVDG